MDYLVNWGLGEGVYVPPWQVLLIGTVLTVIAAFVGLIVLLNILAHHPRPSLPSELLYDTPDRKRQKLPTLLDAPETEVSIVVPAYNEIERLPGMLEETVAYLTSTHAGQWEILIIDDGSKDGTSDVALGWARRKQEEGKVRDGEVRVVRLEINRGKGGAVAHGMQHVRGKYVLFADADGASRFEDLKLLLGNLKQIETDGLGCAVGSRAHMVSTDAVVKRSLIRNILMHGFHTFLHLLGIRNIADTQCGFKLFTRRACSLIFPSMHVEGWIFDVEVLLLCEKLGVGVVEVPITWHEVDGSKMSLVRDAIMMAKDLVVIRLNYVLGIWKVKKPKKVE
ncbi:hypothetical protein SAICODRAFT_5562 [Saitoella complicata NRRL Y-17804]|nr:uncharacterized protein SAICODRAFT_5562 [Saitoella complicata NRRL Y-17804]ODQ54940.1 hypothetical protein SAICODRAFT_5562 [Saitoella complicata NRRL Y-17804]